MTIYTGTAGYYRRFRPPYPREFYAELATRVRIDGGGMLLDLGSGPGLASLPLTPCFGGLVCVDPEPEMLREGARAAARAGVRNASWIQATAEAFDPNGSRFRLVLMANSFLWMKREQILEKCKSLLEEDGVTAMIQRRSFWEGDEEWRTAILDLVRTYLGPARRTRSGVFDRPLSGHAAVFRASGYTQVAERRIPDERAWTSRTMLGYLYSNSFCSRDLLGNRRRAFERDFRAVWSAFAPDGTLTETIEYDVVYARP